jgi:hypothetical protein
MKITRNHKLIFVALLAFTLIVLPVVVSAQAPFKVCEGPDCDFNHLVLLVQRVINFLIFTLAFPISALMFAYAGILMLTAGGKEGQIKKAKSVFMGVAIGLVLMLAAWLIVYTITNILIDDEFEIPEEVQLEQ